MQATTLIASLAFIAIATAAPFNEVVPEDAAFAMDDDLSEARETLSQMQAAGRSDKDCRKLVEETKKEIKTNVENGQKVIDALPRGEHCMNLGQELVTSTTLIKTKADKHVTHCQRVISTCQGTQVDFGYRTFESLTFNKCSSFYSSTAYVSVKTKYTAAVTAHTRAVGAAGAAAISLKNAIAAAAKSKHECLCRTRVDHDKAYKNGMSSNGANAKAWSFAHRLECVLDGKATCAVPRLPMVARAKLTSAAQEESC